MDVDSANEEQVESENTGKATPFGVKSSGEGKKQQSSRGSKAQGKRKEVAKSNVTVESSGDEEDGEEEVEEIEEAGQACSGVSELDQRCNDAIISINVLNLMYPPLPLHFGQWNNRPLNDGQARKLLQSMRDQEFRQFNFAHMIPLIIHKSHLDPSCIFMQVANGAQAPELKLTAEGLTMTMLEAAGGRHRYRAVQMHNESINDDIRKNRAQIEAKRTKGRAGLDVLEKKVRRDIEHLENQRQWTSKWGVIVYDADIMLANGGELALHLSRNVPVQQYSETESEKLLMILRGYQAKLQGSQGIGRSMSAKKGVEQYLANLGRQKNSAVGQVMNHAETRAYLEMLDRLGGHFHHQDVFSTTWVKKHLHAIGGQIVMHVVQYLSMIWMTLLAPMSYFEMSDSQKFAKYRAEIAKPKEERCMDLARLGRIAWKSMVEPEYVLARIPRLGLLTETLMGRLKATQLGFDACLLQQDQGQRPEEWGEYEQAVRETFEICIGNVPFESAEDLRVRDMIDQKIQWILFDHREEHYQRPLPLLTPSVITGLVQMVEMIPEGLTEFLRWFDPLAEYFCFNFKSADGAKDMSAWVLRTLRANRANIFDRPEQAANELAHMPIKYFEVFVQLERDMHSIGLPPPRPRLAPEQKPKALEQAFPGSQIAVQELIKTMKENRKGRLVSNWVLQFESHHDWRDHTKVKNAARDFVRFAQAAHVEPLIVNQYRPKLLADSQAAMFLRSEAKRTLSRYCKTQNQFAGATSIQPRREYRYPDGLATQDVARPEGELEDILATRGRDCNLQHRLQELENVLRKVNKLECLQARPGSQEVRQEVQEALERFVVLAAQNASRLEDMAEAEDPKAVDPMARRWREIATPKISWERRSKWDEDSEEATALARYLAVKAQKKQVAGDAQDEHGDTNCSSDDTDHWPQQHASNKASKVTLRTSKIIEVTDAKITNACSSAATDKRTVEDTINVVTKPRNIATTPKPRSAQQSAIPQKQVCLLKLTNQHSNPSPQVALAAPPPQPADPLDTNGVREPFVSLTSIASRQSFSPSAIGDSDIGQSSTAAASALTTGAKRAMPDSGHSPDRRKLKTRTATNAESDSDDEVILIRRTRPRTAAK